MSFKWIFLMSHGSTMHCLPVGNNTFLSKVLGGLMARANVQEKGNEEGGGNGGVVRNTFPHHNHCQCILQLCWSSSRIILSFYLYYSCFCRPWTPPHSHGLMLAIFYHRLGGLVMRSHSSCFLAWAMVVPCTAHPWDTMRFFWRPFMNTRPISRRGTMRNTA